MDLRVWGVYQLSSLYRDSVVTISRIDESRPKMKYVTQAPAVGAKRYLASEDMFAHDLGNLPENHPLRSPGSAAEVLKSNVDAMFESETRRNYLRSLKYGDPIMLNRRTGKVEQWTFIDYLPGGRKYVFSARNAKGTAYRFQLEALVLPEANQTA